MLFHAFLEKMFCFSVHTECCLAEGGQRCVLSFCAPTIVRVKTNLCRNLDSIRLAFLSPLFAAKS